MGKVSDQGYLVTQQYHDGSNLAARGGLFERFGINRYGWFRWYFEHLQLPAQCRILELGCGTGMLWLKGRESMGQIPPGWEVTLSDLSEGMVQEAGQNLEHSGHPFDFAVIDAQAIPYPDASLDAILANFMLYHVPDRPRALREMRRVLRPGGRLYATTGGKDHLRELDAFRPGREDDFGNVSPFSLENGRDQLGAWFEHVAVHRYDDGLVVTDAEPLVAHLLSKYIAPPLDDAERRELGRKVQEAITMHGSIRVTKDFGLFEAW